MKLLVFLALVLSAPSPAALIPYQEIGDYRAELHYIGNVQQPRYLLNFTGPNGTKQFFFWAEMIEQMVLGSLGKVALVGQDEWVDIIEYTDTPVLPWMPFMRLQNIDTGGPLFAWPGSPFFSRDYGWSPILSIQDGVLVAQMQGHFTESSQGNVIGTYLARYTHSFQVPMGVQAIPEPASIGLFAAGAALAFLAANPKK